MEINIRGLRVSNVLIIAFTSLLVASSAVASSARIPRIPRAVATTTDPDGSTSTTQTSTFTQGRNLPPGYFQDIINAKQYEVLAYKSQLERFKLLVLAASVGRASREELQAAGREAGPYQRRASHDFVLLQDSTSGNDSLPLCQEPPAEGVKAQNIVFAFILLVLSGLFSGLTLGLMGLDIVGLDIVIASGSDEERKYAAKIKPLRSRGNWLLCTLLLGNTLVNAALAILTDSLFPGTVGLIIATVGIVIFGEISPQAACSRHALRIGYLTIPIVYVFLVLMAPVAWPLSKVLDYLLGDEIGTIYTRSMLKKLLAIHTDHSGTSGLKKSDAIVLSGAIDFSQKIAKYAMTPMKDVFGIDINAIFDVELRQKVVESGYSRIPVFEDGPGKITQLLLVRDMLLLNPEDQTPIASMLPVYGRPILTCFDDVHLDDLLNTFKKAHCHMAVVHTVNSDGPGDPFYENVGIITLEDLFEELIQDEIVDETDVYVDVGAENKIRVGGVNRVSYKALMPKQGPGSSLSQEQVLAISSYLAASDPLFSADIINPEVLQSLVQQQGVYKLEWNENDEETRPPTLYETDKPTSHFTLILSGKVKVRSGKDSFISELGPWKTMGRDALVGEVFVPDFDAESDCGLLEVWRLPRAEYQSAIRATGLKDLIKTGHVSDNAELERKVRGASLANSTGSSVQQERLQGAEAPMHHTVASTGSSAGGKGRGGADQKSTASGTTLRAAASLGDGKGTAGVGNKRVADLQSEIATDLPRLSEDDDAASSNAQ